MRLPPIFYELIIKSLFSLSLVTITAWGMGKSFGFSCNLFESAVLALSGEPRYDFPDPIAHVTSDFNSLPAQREGHLAEGHDTHEHVVASHYLYFGLSFRAGTYLVVATTSWFNPNLGPGNAAVPSLLPLPRT